MLGKGNTGIIEVMTKKGRPWECNKEKITKAIQDFSLSQTFGWTPQEIDNLQDERRMIYLSLLSGVSEGQNNNG